MLVINPKIALYVLLLVSWVDTLNQSQYDVMW